MLISDENKSVLVGLSGGVDSAVCCMLLLDSGYSVTGLYCVMSDEHQNGLEFAQKTADELGIGLIVRDLKKVFHEKVILPFMQNYCEGKTPNPCIICNEQVKFKALSEIADSIGVRYISTGHYAGIEINKGIYIIRKAPDYKRDQSYMLYRLRQDILSRLLLPLAGYSKKDVRRTASENKLTVSFLPDSEDICFIPCSDHTGYLHNNGYIGKKGCFISPEGEDLGPHKGVEFYTVGQRRGLGVNLGKPVYVQRIMDNGDICLSFNDGGYAEGVILSDYIINPRFISLEQFEFTVKIRYAAEPVTSAITRDRDHLRLVFSTPRRAAAPGQSAVFYVDDLLAGGGIIEEFF